MCKQGAKAKNLCTCAAFSDKEDQGLAAARYGCKHLKVPCLGWVFYDKTYESQTCRTVCITAARLKQLGVPPAQTKMEADMVPFQGKVVFVGPVCGVLVICIESAQPSPALSPNSLATRRNPSHHVRAGLLWVLRR